MGSVCFDRSHLRVAARPLQPSLGRLHQELPHIHGLSAHPLLRPDILPQECRRRNYSGRCNNSYRRILLNSCFLRTLWPIFFSLLYDRRANLTPRLPGGVVFSYQENRPPHLHLRGVNLVKRSSFYLIVYST